MTLSSTLPEEQDMYVVTAHTRKCWGMINSKNSGKLLYQISCIEQTVQLIKCMLICQLNYKQ